MKSGDLFYALYKLLKRVCVLSFNANELLTFKILIQQFSEKYIELFPDTNFKPKSHFLNHYHPKMIKGLDFWLKLSALRLNLVILKDCAKL